MAGVLALGLLVHSARFIYDAFVFSTEWCVFLILIMALYNVIMIIISRVRDNIVLWVIIFAVHVVVRFLMVYSDDDPDTPGVVGHSTRFIYDAFLFSVEWSIFLILILAIYNLIMLILSHLQNAIIVWVLIFFMHVFLRIVYSHSSDYFNTW